MVLRLAFGAWIGGTVALATGAGRGDELVRWIDPPIRLAGQDGRAHGGPASVDVGFTEAGRYTSLADVSELVVIHGLQGGTWTMPTVRTRGIAPFALVICEVVTAAGERVGAVDARTRFFPSADGPLEIAGLPIPIRHADATRPIDDLNGQRATLDCAVDDGEAGRAAARFDVTLVGGLLSTAEVVSPPIKPLTRHAGHSTATLKRTRVETAFVARNLSRRKYCPRHGEADFHPPRPRGSLSTQGTQQSPGTVGPVREHRLAAAMPSPCRPVTRPSRGPHAPEGLGPPRIPARGEPSRRTAHLPLNNSRLSVLGRELAS